MARVDTSYDWCDCRKGLARVTAWPDGDKSQLVTVHANSTSTVTFAAPTAKLGWRCDGMGRDQTAELSTASSTWSIRLTVEMKAGTFGTCGKATGRLKWNTWEPASYTTSIPFTSGDDGYACMKIPVLLRTENGTLLAFAEARNPDCGDFSRTDLVLKRSSDGGLSWGPLQVLAETEQPGLCGHPVVYGNAAPVQVRSGSAHHPGRIIVPHTVNNFEVWSTHSDDDGISWSPSRKIPGVSRTAKGGPDCHRNMSYFGVDNVATFAAWVKVCHAKLEPSHPKPKPTLRSWAGAQESTRTRNGRRSSSDLGSSLGWGRRARSNSRQRDGSWSLVTIPTSVASQEEVGKEPALRFRYRSCTTTSHTVIL